MYLETDNLIVNYFNILIVVDDDAEVDPLVDELDEAVPDAVEDEVDEP